MSTISSDQWLTDHDIVDENANEMMYKINQRNQFPKNSMAFSRSDIQVQQLMRNFRQKLDQLQEQLILTSRTNQLTQRESERRQRLIDSLNYRYKQMEISLENPDIDRRSTLLGNPSHSMYGTNNYDLESNSETNGARNINAEEFRTQQKLLVKEQDKGLESLSEIIGRQKHMAHGMSSEIDLQNEILDDIGDVMDQTNDRLVRNTRNIRKVGRKAGTCGQYWIIVGPDSSA